MSDNYSVGYILRCMLWWMFVLVWFCFMKKVVQMNRREVESENVVQSQSPWHTWTEEELEARKDVIENALITKKIGAKGKECPISRSTSCCDMNDDRCKVVKDDIGKMKKSPSFVQETPEEDRKQEQGGIIKRSLSFISLMFEQITNSDDNENICSICLCEYETGEEISWSPNEHCKHSFHKECITEWLMKRDDCPVCRRNFVENEGQGTLDHNSTHVDDNDFDIISYDSFSSQEIPLNDHDREAPVIVVISDSSRSGEFGVSDIENV